MEITIDPRIQENGLFDQTVRKWNDTLQAWAKRSRNGANVDWQLTYDAKHQPVLSLRLIDSFGVIEKTFNAEELQDEEQLWFRMHRLWSDLLQNRTDKLVEKMLSE